jgi:hypothetical protein
MAKFNAYGCLTVGVFFIIFGLGSRVLLPELRAVPWVSIGAGICLTVWGLWYAAIAKREK